ncbi:MAG: RNA 2',3'-cyclic phosphodiesterase [Pseudomonadota bacterium]
MSNHGPTQRVFFALWPDEPTRRECARLLRSMPRRRGRSVAEENLHITLAFIGSVDDAMLRCLLARAAQIRAKSFSLALTRVGYFARAKVLWLGPESCPAPMQGLVQRLNEGLSHCGYHPDSRPFAAHLTLFRKAQPSKSKIEISPVQWRVKVFCLVESRAYPQGVRYHVLRRYPLVP